MARKKTSKPKEDAEEKSIPEVDAEEQISSDAPKDLPEEPATEETPADEDVVVEEIDAPVASEDKSDEEDVSEGSPEPDTEPDALVLEDKDVVDADPPEADEDISEPTQPERVHTETVIERKGGFMPTVLGGLVAAGIGFAAAYFGFPQDSGDELKRLEQSVTSALYAQSEQIEALSAQVTATEPAMDMEAINAAQNELVAGMQDLSGQFDAVATQLAEFDARLSDVEKRPITEGASDTAVAAYERELKALQDAMATQRAEIEAMTSEAQSLEESAEEIARMTMQRAALTRIQTALDSGSGFAAALADLEASGADVPDALSAVASDGAPSLTTLQAAFPDVARAALAASRQAAAEAGEGGGFGAFLKTQLGARSLEPREGSDPDAILSRAEAAAREGRLTDALAEIDALPEVGRAEIAEWAAAASTRLEALAAVETLGQELN